MKLILFALVLSYIASITCLDLPNFQWTIIHNWTNDAGTFQNSYSNHMVASNGQIYATSLSGNGNATNGGIYSIDPKNDFAYSEPLHLTGTSGLYPGSLPSFGLVEVPGSNTLWGLVHNPYSNVDGGLFSWNFNTGLYRIEYNFSDNFYGNPTYDSTSNLLLWTSFNGGQFNKGRVFAFDPSLHTSSVRADLPSNSFLSSFLYYGGFTKAPNGKFYIVGYARNGNAIYCFDISTNQVSLVWNTTDPNVSDEAFTFLTLHPQGNLYWGTHSNPTNILEFNPRTDQVKIVAVLDPNIEGYFINANPLINLKTQFGDLLLAGTAQGNPYNGGSLAIFDPATGFHASIHNGTQIMMDGYHFESAPVQLPDGSIIGSSLYGGPAGTGAFYRLTGFTIPSAIGAASTVYPLLSYIFILALTLGFYLC